MGAADIVPGVSGGTIAFVTGIYERLILALKAVPMAALKLPSNGLAETWRKVDGTFLVVLFAGIATSIVSLAHGMSYLLENEPVLVWSFFFGLVLASALLIGRNIKWLAPDRLVLFAAGVLSAFWITTLSPVHQDPSLLLVFASGFLAICAMILPGISGAFILVLIGMYHYMIEGLKSFDLPIVVVFCLGAGIGLISFTQLLAWMFQRMPQQTLALLTGFLLGSLNKVWPWKIPSNGAEQNVLPQNYLELTQHDPYLVTAIIAMAFGAVLIAIFARFDPDGAEKYS